MTQIHPFERAGLGKAPFRFIGMVHQDRLYGQAILNRAEYQQTGIAITTKPGGSCDYCATYIVDMFKVQSADGRTFKVGCDCIRKVDMKLAREIDATVRKLRREKRHASEAARIAGFEKMMDETDAADRLRSLPHPRGFAGQTMLDWVNWMWANSGTAGRIRTIRTVKKTLEG